MVLHGHSIPAIVISIPGCWTKMLHDLGASTLSGLALGRGSEPFIGHTDHPVTSILSCLRRDRHPRASAPSVLHSRHFHTSSPKLPFILSTQTFPTLARWFLLSANWSVWAAPFHIWSTVYVYENCRGFALLFYKK